MPAGFFAQGEIQVFVRPRWYTWEYLGTAITSPHIHAGVIYRPVNSERVDPGPYMEMLCTEQHLVSIVINRLDHRAWNRIRDVGVAFNAGFGGPFVREIKSGTIVTGEFDFELFLKYAHPSRTIGRVVPPDAAANGRLYYSAVLKDYEEDAPERVQEVGMLIECNPYPRKFTETIESQGQTIQGPTQKKLILFTERPGDFPTVTPE
jgi:hypothetical protein